MFDSAFSPDRAAVRHLLSTPHLARRTAPFLRGDDVDWDGLAAEAPTLSGGEGLLVALARDLWYGTRTVGAPDLVRRLDERSFRRVVQALLLARSTPRPAAAPASRPDALPTLRRAS